MDADLMERLTAPTEFLDYQQPQVRDFVARTVDGADSPREQAVRLYYAVRDGLHYEVYRQDLSRDGLRASTIVQRGEGFCVHKSILYAAAVRAVGIPSRIVVSEVRNHLASPQLKALVGGEVFVHWLASVHLDGRWLRVTPVFNKMLCRLYGMEALDFDGVSEARLHPFGPDGQMEFLAEHGEFDDVEYERLTAIMRARHPAMYSAPLVPGEGSLADEANAGE